MGERCGCTILSAMVIKAFKKCGISNTMDGTEDEMLWAVDSDKESSDNDDELRIPPHGRCTGPSS